MKKYLSLVLALVLVGLSLAGCSSASYDRAAVKEMSAAEEPAMANDTLTAAGGAALAETGVPDNRKWIITVHLSAETDDMETLTAALETRIAEFDGYVENQSVYNGSAYAQSRYRNASLTIRIPAEKVDGFVESVGEVSNIVSQEKSREDITLTYVDTESRKTALETEEARLLELLAEAETMADLLEIEARLTDVRYELDSITSQLRTMDNQVNYATINLYISEVQEYTPVEEPTFLERITKGFKASMEGVAEDAVDLVVWAIIMIPYLVFWGAIAAVAWPLLRRLRTWMQKRRERKKAKKENK